MRKQYWTVIGLSALLAVFGTGCIGDPVLQRGLTLQPTKYGQSDLIEFQNMEIDLSQLPPSSITHQETSVRAWRGQVTELEITGSYKIVLVPTTYP